MIALLIALTSLLQAGAVPTKPEGAASRPIKFSLPAQLKKRIAEKDGVIAIRGGHDVQLLSWMYLGDFEATGEVRLGRSDTDARLLVRLNDDNERHHTEDMVSIGNTADAGRRPGVVFARSKAPADEAVSDAFRTHADEWHRLTVRCVGRSLRVLVDDRLLTDSSVRDETYGSFGFRVPDGELQLRGWRVTPLDAFRIQRPLEARFDAEHSELAPNSREPRLRHEVRPTYNATAMRAKLQGIVSLEAVVETDGSVGDVRVTKELGLGLDIEAVRAVKRWRFSPGTIDGKPVRVRVSIEMTFTLH